MAEETFRTEKDSMGVVQVPSSKLYGAQTQRALDNFTISKQPLPWNLIDALLIIKGAAAYANGKLTLLNPGQAKQIQDAVSTLRITKPVGEFQVSVFQTGSGTSTNMNVNEVICGMAAKEGAALSPNDHVNLCQSSNDVFPTAIYLSALIAVKSSLIPELKHLAHTIQTCAFNNKDVIKTARTHLMDALPIRFQDELGAWEAQLGECVERMEDSMVRMARLPLGGTAVGSGVNCHPKFAKLAINRIAQETDLALSQAPSLYKGLSSLDTLVEFSGQLKTCALVLRKIANDLRWMNSGPQTGLQEIQLPALQPGSSIMPAKVNPVIAEAVIMSSAQVVGNDMTISLAGMGGNFQLNTMLPLAAANILHSLELLAGSAQALGEKAIKGIQVNRHQFREALERNPILVTALNPIIGYLKAAEIGKIAIAEKKTILDVALKHTSIPKEELVQLLDPKNLADGGRR